MPYPTRVATIAALLSVFLLSACASPGSGTPAQQNTLWQESEAAASRFKSRDPSMQRFFDTAAGHVIFPSVGKGGLWVGGAHGQGTVYEGQALIGHASLTQLTVGFQAGAQVYQEIIFFETQAALERFKRGKYEVAAQVGGVVVTVGASTTAEYQAGVVIFTLPRGGLMYEASVGGQKFVFRPLMGSATAPSAPVPPAAPPAPAAQTAPAAPAAPVAPANE